ncbi:aldo/keto reductase [Planosporangium mesophilum]|uniref:Oxidoreductase n=1 Tax=Planosporangium mesophilum TaxID=689768 RepID=A0A8J3TAM5_9ACTN|nr:aldo/keto reductase [Planosporangium mesophilum]NJC84257.1 aldo/keto reductase [Planosporangium mesophilum]GII23098.1 oxidoreductase [Planosporangium mesophilum]
MRATEPVTLGRTDLVVTRLGLGLAPIGGLYEPVGDTRAVATVDRAWQRGLRLFDTAPLYGYGLSERRAGAALARRPRDGYVLSTKIGRLLEPDGPDTDDVWAEVADGVAPRFDFSYPAVRASLSASLERLGLDRVDVLHIHDPDNHFDAALTGAYRALADLREAGVIGAVGAGMNQAPMLARFAREADAPGFDCFLLAGRYTLLDQSGLNELLPLCAKRGIAVLAGGVYNSGLLADPQPGATYNYAPAPAPVLAKALAIREVCDRHGVPLPAAAIQFPLGHPAVTSVVIGARSPEEVDENIALFEYPIPAALWADLTSEGLLPDHVPTPE